MDFQPTEQEHWIIQSTDIFTKKHNDDILVLHKDSPLVTNQVLEPGDTQRRAGSLDEVLVVVLDGDATGEVMRLLEAYSKGYVNIYRRMTTFNR